MAGTRTWHEIRRAELVEALGDLLRMRAMMAPVAVVMLIALIWYEPAAWRRAALCVALPLMFTIVIFEGVRARRGTLGIGAAAGNGAVMLGGLTLAGVATGGIESPAMPATYVIVLLVAFLGSRRAAVTVWLCAIVLIAATATVQALGLAPGVIPKVFGGAAHSPVRAMAILRGMTLVMMLTATFRIALRVRDAYDRIGERADAASRAALDGVADETRTLALVTGEIAHELRNPLASVKGLAGLVAKDLDGKAAERMAVLRREVDRMQQVLEQFLTLSRPVAPLELAPTDPRALCDDVAALHEGVAADRGVRVEVHGPRGLAIAGDARKLTQVLTNLVQNALAVSPRGAAITIEVAETDGDVVLRVLDEGPGLPAEVAARAFEPGVTTKPDGSGLGLAIARSLARQHGGDVELAARDGGGVAASVRLPREAAS